MIKIKTEKEIELMRHSGKILKDLMIELEKRVAPGIKTKELDEFALKYIKENNSEPSFLGYEGYPANICISINEEIVHGIPGERKIKKGDIVSVDAGVKYKGYHTDSACTFIVGEVSEDIKRLVENTKKALYEGISVVKAGVKLNKVSEAIERIAIKNNYSVIRELAGHGVGASLHEDPFVPNYSSSECNKVILKEGMTLAIEPMFCLGNRKVGIMDNNWTIVTWDGSLAAHFEHTILVTKEGYEIITGE